MTELFGRNLADVFRRYMSGRKSKDVRDKKLDINLKKGHLFAQVEWERLSPKDGLKSVKKMMMYNEHIERLTDTGWDRSPTPQEVYSLIFAYWEDVLPDGNIYRDIAEDWWGAEGEFFNCSGMTLQDRLFVYENVNNLAYEDGQYKLAFDENWHDGEASFDIKGLDISKPQPIDKVNEYNQDIIQYFYGRRLHEFPDFFQRGKSAKIYFPPEGAIAPFGRGPGMIGVDYYQQGASRGVKKL